MSFNYAWMRKIADAATRARAVLISPIWVHDTPSFVRAARMLINIDSSGTSATMIEGCAGGGAIESMLLTQAMNAYRERKTYLMTMDQKSCDLDLDGQDLVSFIIEVLNPSSAPLWEESAVHLMHRHNLCEFVAYRVIKDGAVQEIEADRMFVAMTPDGNLSSCGSLGMQDLEKEVVTKFSVFETDGKVRTFDYRKQQQSDVLCKLISRPYPIQPVLYIFGGSSIGHALGEMAAQCHYTVIVLDDHAEFASADRHPACTAVHYVTSWESTVKSLVIGPDSYAVVLTSSHAADKSIVAELMRTPIRYIGLNGSKRKKNMLLDALRTAGIPEERYGCLYCPIGTTTGGESAGYYEQALSVLCEIQGIRYGVGVGDGNKKARSNSML